MDRKAQLTPMCCWNVPEFLSFRAAAYSSVSDIATSKFQATKATPKHGGGGKHTVMQWTSLIRNTDQYMSNFSAHYIWRCWSFCCPPPGNSYSSKSDVIYVQGAHITQGWMHTWWAAWFLMIAGWVPGTEKYKTAPNTHWKQSTSIQVSSKMHRLLGNAEHS